MEEIEEKWDTLLFGVRRSVRYHERRRNFFGTWNLITSGLSLLFGSAAIYTVLKSYETLAILAGVVVTVVSTVDMVVGTSRTQHLHGDLGRQFIDLEKSMILLSAPNDDDYRAMFAKRLEIEKDEPPIKRTVDVLCHNELVFALGYDKSAYMPVPLYKRLTAHFINWHHWPLHVPEKTEEKQAQEAA